jgi:hypothetical protein
LAINLSGDTGTLPALGAIPVPTFLCKPLNPFSQRVSLLRLFFSTSTTKEIFMSVPLLVKDILPGAYCSFPND